MSSNAHIDSHDSSNNTTADIHQPVTSDRTPLSWDGNAATITGILYETGKFYRRTGLFQPLLSNRAVSLSNGRLAIESPSSVYFTTDKIKDPRDLMNPCPPTLERLQEYNDLTRVPQSRFSGLAAQKPLDSLPTEIDKSTVIISPYTVAAEDAKLLRSLIMVFGQAEPS